MNKSCVLSVVLILSGGVTASAGPIPNGDFETGDFTDWFAQGLGPSVQSVDGSYRAVFDLSAPNGSASAELTTSSDPSDWGTGSMLQFDASFEFATDGIGASVLFTAMTALSNVAIINAVQTDESPLSESSPTATYTMPWGGGWINVFATVLVPAEGDASLRVVLDNFRIVPEPATLVLTASALCALPLLIRARRRRCR